MNSNSIYITENCHESARVVSDHSTTAILFHFGKMTKQAYAGAGPLVVKMCVRVLGPVFGVCFASFSK